jgi:hypothetical protein
MQRVLTTLDALLARHDIGFCALGQCRASTAEQLAWIPAALQCSGRFNVSVALNPGDYPLAQAAATLALSLPPLTGGLGNFRFCVGACCPHGLPFFPGATCRPPSPAVGGEDPVQLDFSLGLENGDTVLEVMRLAGCIQGIAGAVSTVYLPELQLLEAGAKEVAKASGARFLGIDTSFNPSLDPGYEGSVAHAFEQLAEVDTFGSRGTLAAIAAATQAVQVGRGACSTSSASVLPQRAMYVMVCVMVMDGMDVCRRCLCSKSAIAGSCCRCARIVGWPS